MKLHEEIEELEHRLQHLRKEAEKFNELTVEQQLATELHEMFCSANHVDQCGWGYEKWDDLERHMPHSTKNRYLEKAHKIIKLLEGFTPEQIIEVARAIR